VSRRREEERRAVFDDQVRINTQLKGVVNFENNAQQRVKSSALKGQVSALRQGMQVDLERRRSRLADLLRSEDAQYKVELDGLAETTSERRERMKARARELIRRREEEARAHVLEAKTRQFRDSCDAFREHDSRALLEACTESRNEAVQYKRKEQQRRMEEDARYHQHMLELKGKQDRQAEMEQERQQEIRQQMLQTLEMQCAELEAQRQAIRNEQAADAQRLLDQAEADLIKAKQKEKEKKEEYARKNIEMNESNERIQRMRASKKAADEAEDLRLLNAALARERDEAERELRHKQRVQQEALDYKQQLEELMIKEAEDDSAAEAIRQAAQDKEWKKREDLWKAEAAARAALLEDVMKGRKQQIEWQRELRRQEQMTAVEERDAMTYELADHEEKERVRRMQEKAMLNAHQRSLLEQVAEKERRVELEQLQEKMEYQASLRAEAEYQAMLKSEMTKPPVLGRHNIKASQWYT